METEITILQMLDHPNLILGAGIFCKPTFRCGGGGVRHNAVIHVRYFGVSYRQETSGFQMLRAKDQIPHALRAPWGPLPRSSLRLPVES